MQSVFNNMSPVASTIPLSLSRDWLEVLFAHANTVWVGFSGGVDSHVLLHVLVASLSAKQRSQVGVIHVHHGLSENSDAWLHHCETVCLSLDVRFVSKRIELVTESSIEEAARNARYQAFEQILSGNDCLLLAHHAGDQVETVLFRLLRGSGGKGLAGIPSSRALGDAQLIRPLLEVSKAVIEQYADQHQLAWIDDESNQDTRFTRNYLRHHVVPLLESRFPHFEKSIGSAAKRVETDYTMLDRFASQQLARWSNECGGLPLAPLEPLALNERLFWLRHFLQSKHLSVPHPQLENIERMMFGLEDKQPEFVLPSGRIRRHQQSLYLLPKDEPTITGNLVNGEWFERSFDRIKVSGESEVRLGERPVSVSLLMPAGQHRKLKKWLNDLAIPSWWRDHLPFVFVQNELVAIGDLWRHPDYSHVDLEWQVDPCLPFPRQRNMSSDPYPE